MSFCFCCGPCLGDGDGPSPDPSASTAALLSTKRKSGKVKISAMQASSSGSAQIFCEQSVLQDRAYWEVTVESTGKSGIAVGVASADHEPGAALGGGGDAPTSWSIASRELPTPLQAGDVIGVALDQGDYPVSLRFYQNGLPVTEQRGPVTESTPVIELSDGAKVVCNFGAGSWMHKPVSGFRGIIKSRSLLG